MSTCFRRNFQISGFFRESGFSHISGSKNQKTPDFSASFKSNERKLRPVKISARSDENCGFFITTNFWATSTFFFQNLQFLAVCLCFHSYIHESTDTCLKSSHFRPETAKKCQKVPQKSLVIKNGQKSSNVFEILTQNSFRSYNLNEPKKSGLF